MALLTVFLLACVTALATGLGALPVAWLGPARTERWRPLLWGVAAGVMTAASIGLIIEPVDNGQWVPLIFGGVIGVVFLLLGQRAMAGREMRVGELSGVHVRRSALVFVVLFVHSLPEGFALGSSWSAGSTIGLFVFIAIALQNVPEGTATAIPMAQAGFGASQQFWAAVGTSLPQPIGAVIAFLLVEEIKALLPWSLGFAAGAMLALVVLELLPDAIGPRENRPRAAAGIVGSMLCMAGLAALLGA
ncbi:MAG: ZIP family metal transporter [Solirubrobacteraceae bacterium]|nr:ZIP family metal transporter [Solirubrobacteraceae bacterium]